MTTDMEPAQGCRKPAAWARRGRRGRGGTQAARGGSRQRNSRTETKTPGRMQGALSAVPVSAQDIKVKDYAIIMPLRRGLASAWHTLRGIDHCALHMTLHMPYLLLPVAGPFDLVPSLPMPSRPPPRDGCP